MNRIIKKACKAIKRFWKDNCGASETFQVIGYAIMAMVMAGVIAGIGITAAKAKASDISTDLSTFSVTAPADMDTAATSTTFDVSNGTTAVDGITIEK